MIYAAFLEQVKKQRPEQFEETLALPLYCVIDSVLEDAYFYFCETNNQDPENADFHFKDFSFPHDEFHLSVIIDSPKKYGDLDEILIRVCEIDNQYAIATLFKHRLSTQAIDAHWVMREGSNKEGMVFDFKGGRITELPNFEKNENTLVQVVANMLGAFNIAMNKSKIIREGSETNSKKVGPGKGKKAYRDITTIYLDTVHNINKGKAIRNVEWSHSWVVRGHWRYLSNGSALGKDRKGIRNQVGRTWVTPFDKQKHLEKVSKTRVLKVKGESRVQHAV
jgi:hypothetical protein